MTGRAFPDDPFPVQLIQQLFLYRDEAAASGVMEKLRLWGTRDEVTGCGWTGEMYQGALDLGPEVLWSGTQQPGAWRDVLVARYGRAVYVHRAAGTTGGTPYNEDLASATIVQQRLCAHMRICVASRGTATPTGVGPGVDPSPGPSWWDFLQTPHPAASAPYDPWDRLNPTPTPT